MEVRGSKDRLVMQTRQAYDLASRYRAAVGQDPALRGFKRLARKWTIAAGALAAELAGGGQAA